MELGIMPQALSTPLSPRLSGALQGASRGETDFSALLSAQNRPEDVTGTPGEGHSNARAIAKDFEAVFLNTMLSQMFAGIKTPEPFGGGHAEETYRGMMVEEYAKAITDSGGIGIADAVHRQLIELQEAASQ
jgi:flagellar protein FlgJ